LYGKGLELLTPKVSANVGDRLKCHMIRGTAFHKLKMNEEAIMDLKEAIVLSPEDSGLAKQLIEIQGEIDRAEFEASSDED